MNEEMTMDVVEDVIKVVEVEPTTNVSGKGFLIGGGLALVGTVLVLGYKALKKKKNKAEVVEVEDEDLDYFEDEDISEEVKPKKK